MQSYINDNVATSQEVTSAKKVREPSNSVAQLIFFEKIEAGGVYRAAMARTALTISRQSEGEPMLLSEMLAIHGWDQYHAVLDFLNHASGFVITWDPLHLGRLRRWAAE